MRIHLSKSVKTKFELENSSPLKNLAEYQVTSTLSKKGIASNSSNERAESSVT